RDLVDLLTLYRVPDPQRETLLALARQANEPRWRQRARADSRHSSSPARRWRRRGSAVTGPDADQGRRLARRRRADRAAPTAPASAPAAIATGMPIFAAFRPVRKSRTGQPRRRASRRSAGSGLTATGRPTVDSMGRSLMESL